MDKVVWTEPALNSLHEIINYISNDSRLYAHSLGIAIVMAPLRLRLFPYCGRVVPEFSDELIRELIYGSYRIIYQIRGEICFVVAVIHGSRDFLRHIDPGEWIVE